jgi:hypothetical protein
VTTINAAAACNFKKQIARFAALLVVGGGLAGCGTSTNLLSNNQAAKPDAAVAQAPPPTPVVAKPERRIALAPVIGAPDTVAKPLTAQMASSMAQHRVPVAQNGEKSDWTLRGYLVAAKEKSGTKVSYIWDVTDTAGKRVNRITGEEVVPGAAAKDAWAAVTPPLMQKIADRTASSLAAWLPTQGAPTGGPAIAQAAPSAAGGPPSVAAAAVPASAARVASVTPAAASTTTGSLAGAGGSIGAIIVPVKGAPGDGAQSLTQAIQRELQRSGVAIGAGGASAYRVEGRVAVGAGKDGKQPIQIDWDVKDPAGKRVGTVSQKNEIPQGSLDGSWGQTADAAAAAAAQGIVKLLPRQTSTN